MALLLLVGVAPAQLPPPGVDADADAEVPTVVVTPDDPLGASDRKLAKLIRRLPGADDAVEAKRGFGENVGDWLPRRPRSERSATRHAADPAADAAGRRLRAEVAALCCRLLHPCAPAGAAGAVRLRRGRALRAVAGTWVKSTIVPGPSES
jgi:hypothetical protein